MRQMRMTTSLPSRIARKAINELAVLTHCPVHNTPQAMEIIMNDYSAIKKGMQEHVTATVMDRRGCKSWAKLEGGNWVAVMDGELDDFEIRPEDFYDLLCIFRDSGRQVIFNDHSAC